MEEGGIGGAQRGGDCGQPLVPRRSDGVEALTHLLHHAALPVECAAQTLRAKQPQRLFRHQRTLRRLTLRQIARRNAPPKILVNNLGSIHGRSEEHTSEIQSLMRISYAVFCLKKK